MPTATCQVPERLAYRNLPAGLSQLSLPFEPEGRTDPAHQPDSVILDFKGHEFCDPTGSVSLAAFGAHFFRTTRKKVQLDGWRSDGYLSRVRMQEFCAHKDDYPHRRRAGDDQFTDITEVVVAKHRVSASQQALDVLGIDSEGARDLVFYCLEEILRNVEEHADSKVNALFQAQFYPSNHEAVFAVADTGRGILHSLRQRHQNLPSHEEALRYALKPRVSGRNIRRDSVENAGVGLTLTSRLVTRAGGTFQIASGDCVLEVTPSGTKAHKLSEGTRWPGVLVAMVLPRPNGRDWGQLLEQVLEGI